MGRISRHRVRKIRKISICVSTVLIVVLAVLAVIELIGNKKYSDSLTKFEDERITYESQIAQIKEELIAKQNAVTDAEADIMPGICLCIKADTVSELRKAADWLTPYGYPITFVLDTELPEYTASELLNEVAQHESWCVVLSGSGRYLTDFIAREDIIANQQVIPFAYAEETVPTQLKTQLENDAWLGCSDGLGSLATQTSLQIGEKSFCQIGHVNIAEDNLLGNVLRDAMNKKSGFLLTVDMDGLDQYFTENTVPRVMEKIRESYIAENLVSTFTVEQYVDQCVGCMRKKAAAEAELAAFEESSQAQIAALEGKIGELQEKYFPE